MIIPIPVILGLFNQFGIPATKAIVDIVQTWKDKTVLTDADWEPLLAINALPLSAYEAGAVETTTTVTKTKPV